MSRTHTPAGLVVVLTLSAAGDVAAQQPSLVVAGGAQVVRPTGPGLQPQAGTSPYQLAAAAPAFRGVNPFARTAAFLTHAPRLRFAPRPGSAPAGNGVAAVPGAANNPAAFNPGVAAPFPLLVPPVLGPGLPPGGGVAFNPVFVARPAAVSAYYAPPLTNRPPGSFRSPGVGEPPNPSSGSLADAGGAPATGDGAGAPSHPDADAPFNPSSGVAFAPGEPRFLPWVW